MAQQDYSSTWLTAGEHNRLELVSEFGGLTNQLQLSNEGRTADIILGLANRQAMQTDKVYRNIPLFPLVNRLNQGRYRHLDQDYQLPVNEPDRANSLHGFLHHLTPSLYIRVQHEYSQAILTYDYRGENAGYPFSALIEIKYTLKNTGELAIEFRVVNRHIFSIPLGLGWHPYFQLGSGIDQLALKLPKVKQIVVDERLLPTGEVIDFDQFVTLTELQSTQLDHCFAIQDLIHSPAKTYLWSASEQLGLEIWQATGPQKLNFIQVCTDQQRQSIAIEPVTCSINAFNTGDGLVVLEPGGEYTAQMGVRLLTRSDSIQPVPLSGKTS